jgi:uncharacterized protein (DUF433 family)
LGQSDATLLQGYPSLVPADIEAAREYAVAHQAEIAQAARKNAEA